MDPDSLFCNLRTDLSDLLSSGANLVASGDNHEILNAGHLFFDASEQSIRILNKWISSQSFTFLDCANVSFELTPEGNCVSDNTLLVALLAHGLSSITPQGLVDSFNHVNGYHGNPYANLKKFRHVYRFYSEQNVRLPNPAVALELQNSVLLLPQRRLNAYVLYGDHFSQMRSFDPIVHFVGPDKFLLNNPLAFLIFKFSKSLKLLFLMRLFYRALFFLSKRLPRL